VRWFVAGWDVSGHGVRGNKLKAARDPSDGCHARSSHSLRRGAAIPIRSLP
jgi:hypothetical protein